MNVPRPSVVVLIASGVRGKSGEPVVPTTWATPFESTASAQAASHELPPRYVDFAGEIQVANGKPPRWMKVVPYAGIVISLAYYLYVGAFDPVNLAFAVLFVLWMIYTPIAQKRGWFFIPM